MSNLTYIRIDDTIIWKKLSNYSNPYHRNSTDLVLLLNNADGDSHVKSSISIALTVAACAFLLSCYSCCCFNKFSSWTTAPRIRPHLMQSTLIRQNRQQRRRHGLDEEQDSDRNQDQTNSSSPGDVIRRYDLDVESLPSYTIVSGLPTYDDALEQFRKAGIIIPQPSIVNIFEDAAQIKTSPVENTDNTDTASINSCTCDATTETGLPSSSTATVPSVIELNPDQLNLLSRKRLSLQIALNSNQQSRQSNRIDLCREVNRSNLMRSHDLPQIHRSTSSSSLSAERIYAIYKFPSYFQHRGSLA